MSTRSTSSCVCPTCTTASDGNPGGSDGNPGGSDGNPSTNNIGGASTAVGGGGGGGASTDINGKETTALRTIYPTGMLI